MLGAVALHTRAAGVAEMRRCVRSPRAQALLPFLEVGKRGLVAGPDVADPRLLAQFAAGVVVGDSGGDADPARPRTRGPFRRLNKALGFPHRQVLDPLLEQMEELVGVGREVVPFFAPITSPLLTAVAWYFDQPGVGAAQVGQRELLGAEGQAAHCPIHTRALVLAIGLEDLSVLVNTAVVLAWSSFQLGSADASLGAVTRSVVALQAAAVVARQAGAAVVVQLPGTHAATAAAV